MAKVNYMADWNKGVAKRRRGLQRYERQRKGELSGVRRILKKGR